MSIKPVIRSLTDSVEDVSYQVRQLADMFRKHGRKQDRNTSEVQNLDSADVTHPLQTGWKPGTWTPKDVLEAGKGDRPNPRDYLDEDYVTAHLDQFANGATRIYKKGSLDGFGPGNNQAVDGSNTTYVFPTDQLNALMGQVNSPEELGEALGLGADFFVGADVELRDFAPEELDGLRMPSGNDSGTDELAWIPGGYLPSGIAEAVIDIPETSTGFRNGDYVPTSWPGKPREFSL